MPDELIRKYAWVNTIEAWTVAVIKDSQPDEVILSYGGALSESVGDLTFAAVDELRTDNVEFYLQIARRCSAGGGELFSVYWNVNAAGMVTHAIDGAVVAYFESLFPIEPEPRGGDRRPGWAVGSQVEPESAWQVCVAHLERQTGVAVDQAWLVEPHPTYRIPDPYWLYRDIEGADRI